MQAPHFDLWFETLVSGVRGVTLAHDGHPFMYFGLGRNRQQLIWIVDDPVLLEERDLLAKMFLAINIAFDTAAYAVAFEAWALEIAPGKETPRIAPSKSERRIEIVELLAWTADGGSNHWHGRIGRNAEGRIATLDGKRMVGEMRGRFAQLYPDELITTGTRAAVRDLVTALTNVCAIPATGRA